MLSPSNEKVHMPEEVYLNFNHRPQRVIIYNLLIFLWSISNTLFYCDIVSNTPTSVTMFHDSTNNLILIYHLMVCTASSLVLLVFYYQFKVKDINTISISVSIARNNVELSLIETINLFLGFIYFISSLLHFAITWKMCGDVCGAMNKPSGCHITIISSTLLCMIFPLILCVDIIDNYLRNPNKRILCFTLFIFLSTFPYILEFQSNDFGDETYYLSSYILFAQTSFWLITAATAIIYICEGFYHEGELKKTLEIIISFILLCSPIVAFGTNVIEFNQLIGSHQTWFIIVILSIFVSYDLQRLTHFNINVIGAQSTMRERLIIASPTDCGVHTPTFMKDAQEDDDKKDAQDEENDNPFSYLVFKTFAFKLDNKKQRLILFNTLLLLYGVGKFIYFFNFWVNYDEKSFHHLKAMRTRDFSMNLDQTTYAWYCASFMLMIILSMAVIFMEWFVLSNVNQIRYTFYRYSCGVLYGFSGILQLIAVIHGTNDYCKHLGRSLNNNGSYYCHMQYIGIHLISILLPLLILSLDIIGLTKWLFGHTHARVVSFHFIISVSSLLFYVGYYNYYSDLDSYTIVKLTGLLMITFSFIFSTIMPPLFIYLQSNTFSKVSTFISTVLIIVGTAFVLDVNNLYINIADWTLFVPTCCLVAYEIQLLH